MNTAVLSSPCEAWDRARQVLGMEIPGELGSLCEAGVRVIERSIHEDPLLSVRGRAAAQAALCGCVVGWFHIFRDLQRHPALASVAVRKPLFIVGYSRTGSTLLHNLLALDPGARAPRLWELWHPAPPPRAATYETDPRIAGARRRLAPLKRAVPAFFDAHPMSETGPEECAWILWHNHTLAAQFTSPDYWRWLAALSPREQGVLYEVYVRTVKLLTLELPGEHWLGKAQAHLHYLPALLNQFPDARIIRLHRDPARAIPSLCSLFAMQQAMHSIWYNERVAASPELMGQLALDMFVHGAGQMIATADEIPAERVVDVTYEELVSAPLATVRRIYEHLGYPWPQELESAVGAYLTRDGKANRRTHRYTPEDFGLSAARIRASTAAYREWLAKRASIDWGARAGSA